MPITTDEAYTFLNFVYVKDYFNLSIANNHLLNTLLISLSTKISNLELFIRLPNLIFAFFYFFLANKLIKSSQKPFASFCIFLILPYVLEFFSYARGYGITFCLNFFGLYYFLNNSPSNLKSYFVPSIFFYIGSLALSYNLLFLSAFFILFIKKNKSFLKNKGFIGGNLLLFIISIPLLRIIIFSTGSGKPLYGLPEDLDFSYFIKYFFGYTLLLDINFEYGYIFMSFLMFLLLLKNSLNLESDFKFLFVLINLQFFLFPLITNRPLPLLRLLIPFTPIIILWVYQVLQESKVNKKLNFYTINIFFLLLLLNSLSKFDLFNSRVWPSLTRAQLHSKSQSKGSCEYLFSGEGGYVFEYYIIINNIFC